MDGDCWRLSSQETKPVPDCLASLGREAEWISAQLFMNEGQAEGEIQTREHRVGKTLDAKLLGINDLVGRYSG